MTTNCQIEQPQTVPNIIIKVIIATAILRILLLAVSPMQGVGSYEQLIIAENAVEGNGFDLVWPYPSQRDGYDAGIKHDPTPHPSAFMPPFVPAVYTVGYFFCGVGYTAIYVVMIVQCLVGSLIPYFVYRIACRFGSHAQAMVACIVSLLYIPGLLSSATPAGAVFYGLFGLIVVDLSMQPIKRNRTAWLLGLSLGLLALMRSEFLLIGTIVALLPLLHKPFFRNWQPVVITLITMMCTISPWLIRNAIVFGKPVGIITHPWREMWRGANYRASGSGYDAEGWNIWEGERFPQIVKRLDSIPFNRTFELQADNVFKDEVITYVRNNPVHWLMLGLKKILMLWSFDPYYPRGTNPVYVIPTVLTSILILCGLGVAIRKRLPIQPILVILACLTGLFGITYVLPRYQTYLFTVGMPLIACLPIPTFVQSFLNKHLKT